MRHPLVLPIAHLLLTGLSVVVVAKVLRGVRVTSYWSAVLFALVVAVLNALAWTYLAPLTVPFHLVTLGIGGLVVNGLIFMVASAIVPGVEVSGCITAVLASLGVTLVNWLMHFFLGKWAPP